MIEEAVDKKMEREEYVYLIEEVMAENPQVVEDVRKGRVGKVKFLVGMGLRKARERSVGGVEPRDLEEVLGQRISAGDLEGAR